MIVDVPRHQNKRSIFAHGQRANGPNGVEPGPFQLVFAHAIAAERLADLPVSRVNKSHRRPAAVKG